jgi:hypothetical protein
MGHITHFAESVVVWYFKKKEIQNHNLLGNGEILCPRQCKFLRFRGIRSLQLSEETDMDFTMLCKAIEKKAWDEAAQLLVSICEHRIDYLICLIYAIRVQGLHAGHPSSDWLMRSLKDAQYLDDCISGWAIPWQEWIKSTHWDGRQGVEANLQARRHKVLVYTITMLCDAMELHRLHPIDSKPELPTDDEETTTFMQSTVSQACVKLTNQWERSTKEMVIVWSVICYVHTDEMQWGEGSM